MEEKNEKQSEKRQSAPVQLEKLNSPDISASSVMGKEEVGRKLQMMRKDHRYGKEENERCLEITYALLWEWVFISIRSVMPSQDIDRGVKGGKGRLSGNVRETSVVGHKVNHLLLHVLSVIFHPFGSLAEPSGGDHVVTNLRRVLFIIERESPVRREFI